MNLKSKTKIQNLKRSFEFHAADRKFQKFSKFHKNFTFSHIISRFYKPKHIPGLIISPF